MTEQPHREVAVLNAALELPPAERTAYLDRACSGDAALRKQVEALLQAHDQAGGFLDAPPPSLDFSRTVKVNLLLTEKPGDKIGRYKLFQQIGEGGCGVVYMAEQEEPVRRRVALKVIKLGMDTKQVIARFEAERQALALMDHPNIAKVLDAGATETGRPYFVMELVRGIKITEFCDENKLSTEDRLKLFIQVCQAIQHAHQKGVIHRDIKPSNILVTVNDGVPVPKVIDFGIAKATSGRLTDHTLFTAFEQFIGTPAYMSPEQAVMTSQDIDTRSDIYSLGVLLYELLTGHTPFDQKELLAAGLDEMRRTIREMEPARPSTRLSAMAERESTTAAEHRRTEVPKLIHLLRGDLDWIVMKCLEKDRSRRYEAANGLAMDIQRHLNNEPVVARPPSKFYEFQKTVRRHKFGFAATGAVIVALTIGVTLATMEAVRATRAEREQTRLRQQAEANEKKAQTEATKSRQVAKFLKDMLHGASPYDELPMDRDRTALREITDRTAARIGEELKGQPEVEAELRQTLASTYSGIGESAKAEEQAREALRLRRMIFGETNKIVLHSLHELAFILGYSGKALEAEPLARQALAISQIVCGSDSDDTADSMDTLSGVLEGRRDMLVEAEKLRRNALEIYRNLHGAESPEVAWTMRGLAAILSGEGKFAEAAGFAREALTQNRKLHGENGYVLLAMDQLAWALRGQGKLEEVVVLLREQLEIRKKNLGGHDPKTLDTLQGLAEVLVQLGKLPEAEQRLRELLSIKKATTNYSETLWTLATLADILRREGNSTEARAFAHEAVAVCTNHPITLPPWQENGIFESLRNLLREPEDAPSLEAVAACFLQDSQKNRSPEDPWLIIALSNYASALVRSGNAAKGRAFAEEAFKFYRGHPGVVEGWMFGRVFSALRDVLKALGDTDTLVAIVSQEANSLAHSSNPNSVTVIVRQVATELASLEKWREAEALVLAQLEVAPSNTEYRALLGNIKAARDDWAAAAEQFARAVETSPDDVEDRYNLTVALLANDRKEEYRQQAGLLLEHAAESFRSHGAAAKAALLLPLDGAGFQRACELADTAITANGSAYWPREIKALADLRRGQYESALNWAERSSASQDAVAACKAVNSFIEACAYAHLQQTQSARQALATGDEWASQRSAEPFGPLYWHDWAIAGIMRREAQSLLGNPPAPAKNEKN